MLDIDVIIKFVSEKTCCDNVSPASDIVHELSCYGDDFHGFINDYSQIFHVNMTSYLWYFHTEEDGNSFSIGGYFFKSPSERVKRIPVTPAMLFEFAKKGKWEILYPEVKIPKRRYDLLINQTLLLLSTGFAVYYFIKKVF